MTLLHPKSTDLTFEELEHIYRIAATVVAKFGDTYLPLFERVHSELQARREKQDLKAIALAYAQNT